jgi:hypothetical protein
LSRFWPDQPGSGPSRSPLFRLHVARVDDRPRPLDRTRRPQAREQQLVQPLPDTRLLPLVQAPPTGHPGAEAQLGRQMRPRDPRGEHEQDPLQRFPIRKPLPPRIPENTDTTPTPQPPAAMTTSSSQPASLSGPPRTGKPPSLAPTIRAASHAPASQPPTRSSSPPTPATGTTPTTPEPGTSERL